jgi:hypothetical protein
MSRDSHGDLSSTVARIEARIDELDREITTVAPLVHERARLLRARAVLLDEPAPAIREVRPQRIIHEDVFLFLARNPGSRAGQIAAGLDVGQGAVSAHLYRGKGRLFASRDGRWYPIPAADPG